jgi:PIN domain nuclease of toxin-antitoxin system
LKLLLDTHIWIWALLEPGRLAAPVAKALRSTRNELWLSAMSTWEFVVLVERGRVALDVGVDEWLAEARRIAPTNEAPITHEIARESRRIELPHQDPVDRMLAATARSLDLTLVTADRRLLRARACRMLANR